MIIVILTHLWSSCPKPTVHRFSIQQKLIQYFAKVLNQRVVALTTTAPIGIVCSKFGVNFKHQWICELLDLIHAQISIPQLQDIFYDRCFHSDSSSWFFIFIFQRFLLMISKDHQGFCRFKRRNLPGQPFWIPMNPEKSSCRSTFLDYCESRIVTQAVNLFWISRLSGRKNRVGLDG